MRNTLGRQMSIVEVDSDGGWFGYCASPCKARVHWSSAGGSWGPCGIIGCFGPGMLNGGSAVVPTHVGSQPPPWPGDFCRGSSLERK